MDALKNKHPPIIIARISKLAFATLFKPFEVHLKCVKVIYSSKRMDHFGNDEA